MSSDLKNQFINYMTVQRFSPHTKRSYLTGVKLLAKYYMQSPDTLTNDQIQDYVRYLLEERKLSWGTCNAYLSGIVCFYRHICKWDDTQLQIPPRPRVKKLPIVFSKQEVKRLFAATDNLKHRLLLQTVYSAGLRVSELVRLKPHHIESDPDRMMIRIEQGKGRKDRYTILSHRLLADLRTYWSKYRPVKWLFAGQKPQNHLCEGSAQTAFSLAKKKAGLTKARGIHCLRHSFATHSLYQGTDLFTLKRLLGHASLKSTIIYLHLLPERMQQCKSPLDTLYEDDQ
jgi:site-specific recombinase XerD